MAFKHKNTGMGSHCKTISAYKLQLIHQICNLFPHTHITDPHTKKPLANPPITSASVRTPTCMEADAVATALMLIPSIKEAEEWATQKGLAVWLR